MVKIIFEVASQYRCYFKLLLFCAGFSLSSAEEYYVISDNTTNYIIHTPTLKKNILKRFLYPHKNKKILELLGNYLDSLGYFNVTVDSIRLKDSVIIDTGERSLIDTFIIKRDSSITIDSIKIFSFPIFYNSEIIQNFSHLCLLYYVNRGYPFAQISVTIQEKNFYKKKSDSTDIKEQKKHLNVIFSIQKNEKCVFDDPLFHGDFKTAQKIIAQDILFKKGQLYNDTKVTQTKQRLVSRKYISEVSLSTPRIFLKPGPVTHADSTEYHSNNKSDSLGETKTFSSTETAVIPIKVTDNSGMGIDGAIAYQSKAEINWSGLLTISILNILHRGEEAELFYRGEENLQQFDFGISIPFPFLLPIVSSASFGLEIESKNYGYLHGEFKLLTQLKGMWQAGGAIVGHETTVENGESSWYFIGIDLILDRQSAPYRSQTYSRSLYMRTGTGIAHRTSGRFYRWHFDFSMNSHIPLFKRQAFLGKLKTQIITTDKNDSLHHVEKIRVGGHNSIRGYTENHYSFTLVAYSQTEYLFYYTATGSLYIFIDGGIGFTEKISTNLNNQTVILGYGLGMRIPIKFGRLSIEWARNYKEIKGLGRIHVGINNNLSSRIAM